VRTEHYPLGRHELHTPLSEPVPLGGDDSESRRIRTEVVTWPVVIGGMM